MSEQSEQNMRRVSAELHDGPAQALAVASLRLESLMKRAGVAAGDAEAAGLRTVLGDALGDLRNICRGLSLPELQGRSLRDTLEAAIGAHERRTGVAVLRLPDLLTRLSARMGDAVPGVPWCTEALQLLGSDNVGDPSAFERLIGRTGTHHSRLVAAAWR